MFKYDVETIKHLIKLSKERQAFEAQGFLTDFLNTLISEKEFEQFISEIEKE